MDACDIDSGEVKHATLGAEVILHVNHNHCGSRRIDCNRLRFRIEFNCAASSHTQLLIAGQCTCFEQWNGRQCREHQAAPLFVRLGLHVNHSLCVDLVLAGKPATSRGTPCRTDSLRAAEYSGKPNSNPRPVLIGSAPLFVQIVFLQEFGSELLWRSGNVRATLWRKVHEIPISLPGICNLPDTQSPIRKAAQSATIRVVWPRH